MKRAGVRSRVLLQGSLERSFFPNTPRSSDRAKLKPGSNVNSATVGILVGFGILAILLTIGIVQFCCKYKCKKLKKCCKKKKPTVKDRMLTKVGLKKSKPPFTISGSIK